MKEEGESMASLDWSQCPAVESIPGKLSGAWVFRGTRVPVSAIFENLKTSPIEEWLKTSTSHATRFKPCSTPPPKARSRSKPCA
jgi:hypothetical protein